MAQWLKFYTSDKSIGHAVAANSFASQPVALAVAEVPTLYKNFRLSFMLSRTDYAEALVLVGCAPADVYTAMSADTTFNTNAWMNKWGKYIWAHQTLLFGQPTVADTFRSGVAVSGDLCTVTQRKADINDRIFFIILVHDLGNSATTWNCTYNYECDYLEISQT